MNKESNDFIDLVGQLFPRFAANLAERVRDDPYWLEHVAPGADARLVAALQEEIGVPLPADYLRLLEISRGFWLNGGGI